MTPDARCLLASVTYLEQALARPVLDAPGLCAQQLLTDLVPPRPPPGSPSSPEGRQTLSWARSLTPAELRRRYLHKYTHLSWDLQGCLTLCVRASGASQNAGYHVHVHEGYCWLQTLELLRLWANTLWQAAKR